ncbi:hypothetical protein [Mesobacillus zeae]|uniref:hypothetical protein n=1 Tax=Mesobacillus zeae TaxID=1917180 RepID=UPI0015E6AA11|nr:hypothetical protein [Mesobacillus zeae]
MKYKEKPGLTSSQSITISTRFSIFSVNVRNISFNLSLLSFTHRAISTKAPLLSTKPLNKSIFLSNAHFYWENGNRQCSIPIEQEKNIFRRTTCNRKRFFEFIKGGGESGEKGDEKSNGRYGKITGLLRPAEAIGFSKGKQADDAGRPGELL